METPTRRSNYSLTPTHFKEQKSVVEVDGKYITDETWKSNLRHWLAKPSGNKPHPLGHHPW